MSLFEPLFGDVSGVEALPSPTARGQHSNAASSRLLHVKMKKKKLRLLIVVCVSFLFISYSVFYLWTLKGKVRSSSNLCEPPLIFSSAGGPRVRLKRTHLFSGTMSEQTLQYFLVRGRIGRRDAAEVSWCHGVNSRSRLMEALSGNPPYTLTLTLTLEPCSEVCACPQVLLTCWRPMF